MNNLNYVVEAVLSIADKPMTGYDISKVIRKKMACTHQQVYRALHVITKRGDATVETIPQTDKPDRKVYTMNKIALSHSLELSDFAKTNMGYRLLIDDVVNGADYYPGYVEAMKKAELEYLDSLPVRPVTE